MSSKHTPGEWRAESDGLIVSVNDEYVIARIEKYSDQAPRDQREANARLIADAPKMYELLKAVEYLGLDSSPKDERDEKIAEDTYKSIKAILERHGG